MSGNYPPGCNQVTHDRAFAPNEPEEREREYSFDSACYDLAEHFFPGAPRELLNELAQRFQDQVEGSASAELDAWLDAKLKDHDAVVAAEGDESPF